MEASLNLAPPREGPAVWNADTAPRAKYWPFVAAAGVVVAAGVAWRYRAVGRTFMKSGLGFGGMAIGFLTSPAGQQFTHALIDRWATRRPADDRVDRALRESFPASDATALTYREP